MSYMLELKRICDKDYCTKMATHQVFAYGNQPMGKWCKTHATERVQALAAAEAVNPEGFAR